MTIRVCATTRPDDICNDYALMLLIAQESWDWCRSWTHVNHLDSL